MSNPRKSIKPSKRDFHDIGTAINAISWPATSSMTTHCGSFEPRARGTGVAAGIPTSIASRASRIAAQGCQYAPIQRVISHHKTTVAAEAQVPGPGCSRPMPKNVATSSAQRVVRRRDAPATAGGTPAVRSEISGSRSVSDTSALCFVDGIADGSAGVLAGCGGGAPPPTSACGASPPPTPHSSPSPRPKQHHHPPPPFFNQIGCQDYWTRLTHSSCNLSPYLTWG